MQVLKNVVTLFLFFSAMSNAAQRTPIAPTIGREEEKNVQQNIPSRKMIIKEETMENANIGISDKNRTEVGKFLNMLLDNEFVLYVKTLNYHWNIRGIVFHDFHAMFKEQYEQLLEISDDVAERARAMGVRAHGTMVEFSKNAQLKEEAEVVPTAEQMIKNLLLDHEAIIRIIRADLQKIADQYGDLGTNNFLTEIMERHEKTAWMLRATLEK